MPNEAAKAAKGPGMNAMQHEDQKTTLTFGLKEWFGMFGLALAPAITLLGFFYNFSLGLENRLTNIEVNSANTVSAITKLNLDADRIHSLNIELTALKTKLAYVEERLELSETKK